MTQLPPPIVPEDKDWTYVLTDGCPQCGFDPDFPVTSTGARLRAMIPVWEERLGRPDATTRPEPQIWSPTEYACHVRDVLTLFRQRLQLMLDLDHPTFANWDQDATAVSERYDLAAPATVAAQVRAEATTTAAAWDLIPDGAWDRSGVRSNGTQFTVASFTRYFLHDLDHHLWDVTH